MVWFLLALEQYTNIPALLIGEMSKLYIPGIYCLLGRLYVDSKFKQNKQL